MSRPGDVPDRDDFAERRDLAAAGRDRDADDRDESADQRDEAAQQRDQAVRDRLWTEHLRADAEAPGGRDERAGPDPSSALEQAVIDHEVEVSGVELAREEVRGALDDAHDERRAAARDWHSSQGDRREAARDRGAAAGDRGAATGDRDQAEVDTQLAHESDVDER